MFSRCCTGSRPRGGKRFTRNLDIKTVDDWIKHYELAKEQIKASGGSEDVITNLLGQADNKLEHLHEVRKEKGGDYEYLYSGGRFVDDR